MFDCNKNPIFSSFLYWILDQLAKSVINTVKNKYMSEMDRFDNLIWDYF